MGDQEGTRRAEESPGEIHVCFQSPVSKVMDTQGSLKQTLRAVGSRDGQPLCVTKGYEEGKVLW